MGILGLGNVCSAQGTKPPADRSAKTVVKPCGMTPDAREAIQNILKSVVFSLNDPRVENIQKNFPSYSDQAMNCRYDKVGVVSTQLGGADDLTLLWMFESKYNEARYVREVAFSKQAADQAAAQNSKDAEIINRLGSPSPNPLYQQPTPFHMQCQFVFPGPTLKCNGQVFSPRPLPMLPLSMTCHNSAPGEASCDGDLEP